MYTSSLRSGSPTLASSKSFLEVIINFSIISGSYFAVSGQCHLHLHLLVLDDPRAYSCACPVMGLDEPETGFTRKWKVCLWPLQVVLASQ